MNNLIIIENKQLKTKEYNGERIVTAWDIAELHEREVKRVIEQFTRNKDRMVKNEDYFILNREEFLESQFATASSKYSNNEEFYLFTESGYLLLIKTFTDELSWRIQKALVKTYFKIKELNQNSLNSLDVLKHVTNVLEEHDTKLNILADKVENQITLDHGEQRRLQKAVNVRVYQRAEVTGVEKSKLYSALHRSIKDVFGVASYRDIKRDELKETLNYVSNWIEKADLRNNQTLG